jgi:hypothetical protein
MGMDQTITFQQAVPAWADVAADLARRGLPVQMRMIDGQLAFPDEAPEGDWRELRVAVDQGMITLRREPGRVVCVIWGNAEKELVRAWNAITWVLVHLGGGQVLTPEGPVDAGQYRTVAEFPEQFQTDH